MKPTMPERQRDHEQPHLRSPELQILDALLRIEELLTKPLATKDHGVELEQLQPAQQPAKEEPAKPAPKASRKGGVTRL